MIPCGLTSYIQFCDVYLFEASLSELIHKWKKTDTYTKGVNPRPPSQEVVLFWVSDALLRFTNSCISRA